MIHYIIKRPDGTVLQRGRCGDESEIPCIDGLSAEIIDPTDCRRPEQACTSYRESRQMAYPPIGDQLDAIWKALEGADPAEMVARIRAVKDQFPKT